MEELNDRSFDTGQYLFTQIATALNDNGSTGNDSDELIRTHKSITSLSVNICYPVEDHIPVWLPPMFFTVRYGTVHQKGEV